MKKLIYLIFIALTPLSTFSQIKYDTLNVKQIGEGAFHYSIVAQSVPWTLEVVEIDLTNDTYSLETVKAGDKLAAYERTSSMASRKSTDGHKIIAAINGDFYSGGSPTNLQVTSGEILKTPISRNVFGYSSNKRMFIDRTTYSGVLKIGESSNTINGVNETRNSNEIIFFNHFYGTSTSTNEFGTELTLKAIDPWIVNGEVRSVVIAKAENSGNSALSDTTFVLSGHGSSASLLASVSVGDTLSINHKIIPGTDSMKEAVGGNGRFLNSGVNQGNWPERHPRSALGFNADTTKFYLVTVDGRQSTSAGMTLTELGDFMKGFGAHNALNLDGGGSTTLVVHGEVANSPSDGSGEREVANALMIVSNKSEIGTLDRLNMNPSFNKLYRNDNFVYEIIGTDLNYFPVEVNIQDLTFSLSEGFDAEISGQGVFTAGNNPDSGYVYVEYNGLKDSSFVIVKGITDFNLFPKKTVTDDQNELVFFNKSYDVDGVEQSVYNSNIVWEVEDETIGTIESGVFVGKIEGITNVIASYDGVKDTSEVEVQIGNGEQLVNGFETLEGLSLDGTNIDLNNSSISITNSSFTQGQSALKLDYELTYNGSPDIWAYINTDIPVFGIPDTIMIDGLTDGKKHLIDLGLKDDNGEVFNIRLKRYADNTSFEEYYILMDDIVPEDPFSKFYYPITITSIGIKLKTEQQASANYSGSIFLDNMKVSYPTNISVSNEEEISVPTEVTLKQNYPNPFNPSTNISFILPKTGFITLKIFDVLGREIATIVNENLIAGPHTIRFDASNLSSGVYIYSLTSKDFTVKKRMTLIK